MNRTRRPVPRVSPRSTRRVSNNQSSNNTNQIDEHGRTKLMKLIMVKEEKEAIELINTGQSNPGHVDKYGSTALLDATWSGMEKVALELIKTGHSNSKHVDKNEITALICAIIKNLKKVALELIKTGYSNSKHVDKYGNTALSWSIRRDMESVALELIKTGESNPGHVDKYGSTALLDATWAGMEKVALELIKTGHSNPKHVNKCGDTLFEHTALINSIYKNLEKVALELIKTGESNPDYINKNGDTPLILSIRKKMEKVALELIKTGKSKPDNININGDTALTIAKRNNMEKVIELLEGKTNTETKQIFDLSKKCFDPIEAGEVQIVEFLKSNKHHIIFVFFDKEINKSQCVGIDISVLHGIKFQDYTLYECREAREWYNRGMENSNIIKDVEYFNIKAICGFGDMIHMQSVLDIFKQHKKGQRIFGFQLGRKVTSTISYNSLQDNANITSARHCQPGQTSVIYESVKDIVFDCSKAMSQLF